MSIIPGEMCKDDNYPTLPQQLSDTLNQQEDKKPVIDKIAVWKENSIVLIDPSTILYLTMDKKKVVVHTKDGTFESNSSLEDLEGKLRSKGFFRCHKSFVVNMDYVDKIIPWFNSTFIMKLKTATEQIPVSRYYTKRMRNMLSI